MRKFRWENLRGRGYSRHLGLCVICIGGVMSVCVPQKASASILYRRLILLVFALYVYFLFSSHIQQHFVHKGGNSFRNILAFFRCLHRVTHHYAVQKPSCDLQLPSFVSYSLFCSFERVVETNFYRCILVSILTSWLDPHRTKIMFNRLFSVMHVLDGVRSAGLFSPQVFPFYCLGVIKTNCVLQ